MYIDDGYMSMLFIYFLWESSMHYVVRKKKVTGIRGITANTIVYRALFLKVDLSMFYDNGFRGHFRRYPAAGDTGKLTLFIAVGVQDPDQKVTTVGRRYKESVLRCTMEDSE